jgi:hypothetical protein
MPLFDNTVRLSADPCATRLRDRGNDAMSTYRFEQGAFRREQAPPADLGLSENVRLWHGFGPSPAEFEADARLRGAQEATRVQRSSSQHPAAAELWNAPDMSRGAQPPPAPPPLEPARSRREEVVERELDRFDPMLQPLPVEHVVPEWSAVPARAVARH